LNKPKKLKEGLQSLLFPPVCLICDQDYFTDKIPICKECLNKLSLIPKNILLKKKIPDNLDSLSITFLFDSHYQKIVQYLKYSEYQCIGNKIGQLIADRMQHIALPGSNTYVIPVPLHPIKYRERGYNQAKLIASGFCDWTGFLQNNNILKRIKNTRSQTKLTKKERKENMKEAFQVKTLPPDTENIILIDDVFTTGATMEEAAAALKLAGVKKVMGIASAAPAS
jgi:ComF family protein